MHEYGSIIDGEQVRSGKWIEVRNPFSGDVVAVQLVEVTSGGGPDEAVAEIRFLDSSSGELLSVAHDVPRIATRWREKIIAWETLPYPRIVRYNGRRR